MIHNLSDILDITKAIVVFARLQYFCTRRDHTSILIIHSYYVSVLYN
jgi:hypothetical protein